MRNLYNINSYKLENNELIFSLNETLHTIQFQPAGQVLADSDNFSFIYLVEEGENYSYISFGQQLWPQLVDLLKKEQNPILTINDLKIELDGFHEELLSLVYNIEGNENYGEEFVQVVENTFKEILNNNGQ